MEENQLVLDLYEISDSLEENEKSTVRKAANIIKHIGIPDTFVPTNFPGYFFDTLSERLYSIKVDGILKPIKKYNVDKFMSRKYGWPMNYSYYQLSINGRKKCVFERTLLRKIKKD